MRKVKLGDVLQLHRGYDLPHAKRTAGEIPVISSSGISGSHNVPKCEGPNVITGRYGTIGEVYYHDGPCWPLNTTLYVSDFKGNNPQYVYYLLKYALKELMFGDGSDKSTVPGIDRNVLHMLHVPYESSIEQQTTIVALLSAIDSKIETNGKIIAELESLARTMYDYWFTQFDFPDENGNPYRSSGDTMVHNDTLHRDIPEGWKVGRLSDISHFVDDKRSCLGLSADNYISTDNMVKNRGGIVPSEYLPTEGIATNYKENDVLLSNIRPYFKKIWQADRMGGCCADVLVFRANNIGSSTWLYYTISSDHFFSYVSAGTKGSKMPRGDKEHMLRYEIPIPPVTLLSAYSQLVHPMNLKTAKLHRESAKLTALRDWLLPLLMNGQAIVD